MKKVNNRNLWQEKLTERGEISKESSERKIDERKKIENKLRWMVGKIKNLNYFDFVLFWDKK